MSRQVGTLLLASLALVLLPTPTASQPSADDQPRPSPTFRAGSTAVVVDAIVRDRKGRPVTDLTLQDVEVYEDGVRQQVGALTLVAPDAPWTDEKGRKVWHTGISAERAAAAGPDRTASEGAVIVPGQTMLAMLFERVNPESMVSARNAALNYLETPERPDDFVGVFVANLALETIQTFTNDRGRLRRAIDIAATRATSGSDHGSTGISVGAAPATPGAESDNAAWIWPDRMQGAILPVDLSALRQHDFREVEQLQEGYASIDDLRALTAALSALPGRKTIVFFSNGLPLRGDGVRERFDTMIEEANRANVSIYPVDVVGLRIHSQDRMNARAIQQAAIGDLNAAGDPGVLSGGGALAVSQHVNRGGNTAHVFGRLAKETGGFVIENTNDLAGGFRRIDADRRFHYLLTYTPLNGDFKGEYRRIEVKVKRRGVNVRARSGYVAVHAPGTIPKLGWEAVPLEVLGRSPLPQELPVSARVIRLPRPDAPGRVALAIRVPPNTLAYRVDEGAATYRTDFTILARIRDEKGEIVRKASQPYRLSGPAAQLDAARESEVVFFRSPDLPPGDYTLEYAVHDALANRSAAATLPLTIHPDAPRSLQVSDLLLVERAEAIPEGERDPDHPLVVGEVLLYPRLGEVLTAGTEVPIAFYFAARADAAQSQLTAGVTLTRNGEPIAQGPLTLVAPDSHGQIHQLSRITVGDLSPGEYVLKLTVSDAESTQNRSVRFEVGR